MTNQAARERLFLPAVSVHKHFPSLILIQVCLIVKYEAYASGEYNDNSAPFAPIIAHPNAKQVFGDDFESERKKCMWSVAFICIQS